MVPVTPSAHSIGRRVKAARIVVGLNQAKLAEACGWGIDKVQRFEQGKQVPDAIELGAIAVTVGQSVDYLLNGKDAA